MTFLNKKYLQYLPSKKFSYVILGFVTLGVIFLIGFFFFSTSINYFSSKKEGRLQTNSLTVNELLQLDTDGDGIQDWEEALWGTDKNNKATFDNVSDSVYIQNKKRELNIKEDATTSKNLSETEKFSREFFASFVAMKASGNVDPNTINNFSSALGQKIIYPSLIDSYSEKHVTTTPEDTKKTKLEYYSKVKKLFETYESKGIGDELSVMNDTLTLTSSTASKNRNLLNISNAYQDFAKKTVEIPVPASLISEHLKIANTSNNTGISIATMAKISTDPIIGISGLSQYQKYSEDFIKAVGDLELKLQQ
jgi:hypothetical protein